MTAKYGMKRIGLLGMGLLCLASLSASLKAFVSVEEGLSRAFEVALVGHETEPAAIPEKDQPVAQTPASEPRVSQRQGGHSQGVDAAQPPVAASEADWLKRQFPDGAKPAALTGDLSAGETLTLTLRDHVRQFEIISVRPLSSGEGDGSGIGRLEILARATGHLSNGQPQIVRFTLEADALLPSPETRRVGWWTRDRDTL